MRTLAEVVDIARAAMAEMSGPVTVHEIASQALTHGLFVGPEELRTALHMNPARFRVTRDSDGVERFYTVPVPAQQAVKPRCLREESPVAGWMRHDERIQKRLYETGTDRVTLSLRRSSDASATTDIMIEKVIDGHPFWICASILNRQADISTAAASGWHLWNPARAIYWQDSSLLVPVPSGDACPRLVATWRAANLIAASWATIGLGAHLLGGLADRARVTSEECTPNELAARLHQIQEFSGRGTRGRGGNEGRSISPRDCEDCGRPLEDPLSVSRGIGPVCYQRRIDHHDPVVRMSVADLSTPIDRWVGAFTIRRWNERLKIELTARTSDSP